MNSSSNSKEINPDVKKEEVNSKKLKRKKRQYLQNKRKREKGGESDYVIFNRKNNKIIRQNGIDYHPIKYVRDSSEGNIRTKNYYCGLHEQPKLLGQMESVGRHYADYHPELLYNLKDVIGLRYFLEFRCRTFINKLIKYYPDQFDPHYENNSREVLTQMALDYKTINFINDWVDGVYSKNNYSCLSMFHMIF